MWELNWRALFFALAGIPAIAHAGDQPLYQPSPAWVVPVTLPEGSKSGDAAGILLLDQQDRIEGGRLWTYADTAARIATPELLAQYSTITLPWLPDKGDLIVHELSILRGGETIASKDASLVGIISDRGSQTLATTLVPTLRLWFILHL
jgi:hypothetical protein